MKFRIIKADSTRKICKIDGFRVSGKFLEKLDLVVARLVKEAMIRCQSSKRRTLLAQDV